MAMITMVTLWLAIGAIIAWRLPEPAQNPEDSDALPIGPVSFVILALVQVVLWPIPAVFALAFRSDR